MGYSKVTWAVLAVLAPAAAWCGVLRVPAEYPTINAGLDAASPGDTVLVAPGTYGQFETRLLEGSWVSSVAFLRGDVALVSEGGSDITMLRLDGTVPGFPYVLMAWGAFGTTRLEGFTVTGTAVDVGGLGYTWGERCVIRDCVFRDLADGAGVGGAASDLEVYGCRFENMGRVGITQNAGTLLIEDSEFTYGQQGGAVSLRIDFSHPTALTMRRCRFVGNLKTTGTGGAVFVGGYSTTLIEDCWFESNRTETGSAVGGALYAFGASVVVRNSTFVRNSAQIQAGAAAVGGASVLVEGNTFWGNRSDLNWPEGGSAVYFTSAGALRNNVIAGSEGDEAIGLLEGSGSVLTSCNVFWGNAQGDAVIPLSATDLAVDPLPCDPDAGDFRVHAGSPCLPESGHPGCGTLIGAWGEGCGTVGVEARSWGQVKSDYRTEVR